MLCPECKSDYIEKRYSIGIRVYISIAIAIIIPYGVIFCWIPFIIPYNHLCHVCGSELDRAELLNTDWRERDLLLKDYHQLMEKLSPYLNQWIEDEKGRNFKIGNTRGQILLVNLDDQINFTTHRVVDIVEEKDRVKITASSMVGPIFKSLIVDQSRGFLSDEGKLMEPTLSKIGKEVFTEEEFNTILNENIDLKQWIDQRKMKNKVEVDLIQSTKMNDMVS